MLMAQEYLDIEAHYFTFNRIFFFSLCYYDNKQLENGI